MTGAGLAAPPAQATPRAPLDARRRAVERRLSRLFPEPAEDAGLDAALHWSALGPGKRLRPLLVLGACEAVGGPWRRALPAAVAVECVHAFSLVHDDLPAMDDDDFRRGRPTTHRRYGEALGVLAGDALLALAFEELSRLSGVAPARIVQCVRVLAEASGRRELIAGQAADIAAERRETTGREVLDIHRRKTGALIAASLRLGAIVGGARPAAEQRLARAGRDLGLAFQIQDDLLNRGSGLERLGKRAGTDAARGKATYPGAVGEERAHREAAALAARALRAVRGLGPRARTLERLIEATAARDR